MTSQLAAVYLALKEFAEPLLARLSSLEDLEYLFYRHGWRVGLDDAAFARISKALAVKAASERFLAIAGPLRDRLDSQPDASLSSEEMIAVADAGAALIEAIATFGMPSLDGLPVPLDKADTWANVAGQLFDDLLEEYLRVYHQGVYAVLSAIGCIQYQSTGPSGPHRVPYTRSVFDWSQAVAFIEDPPKALKTVYRWGDAAHPFDHARLVDALVRVLHVVGLPAQRFPASLLSAPLAANSPYRIQDDVDALRTTITYGVLREQKAVLETGVELLPAAAAGEPAASGIVLRPVIRASGEGSVPIGRGLALKWKTAADAGGAIGVAIFPDKTDLVTGPLAIGASIELARTDADPWYIVGSSHTSRIEVRNPSIRFSIAGAADDPEARLEVSAPGVNGVPGARLVVPLGDADSFIKESVGQSAIEVSFSPDVVWSSRSGLAFSGTPKLQVDVPVDVSIGPVRVHRLLLQLSSARNADRPVLELEASAGVDLSLGPVTATVDRIGMRFDVDFAKKPANFGFADVSIGFKPPSGIGLTVETTGVSGGGFLFFDPDAGQYAGVLQLSLQGGITVAAIGLVTTRLPNGAPGFSFLIVITVEHFRPVPLGLGFMLTGIGGLVAVNRTCNEDVLRDGLKNRTLNDLMFPQDPARNALQLLGTYDRAFPPQHGSYLFGPMVQISWGTPPLLTMDLAVVLELGLRTRLVILGRVAAIMPTEQDDLVRLQMNALGVIDFNQSSLSLDAVLYDSRLAGRFPITGSMAMRLNWGRTPVFALSIGGFHPAFKPPPNFPALDRLAITFANADDFRLRCESYFAITSNTLQFGAKLDLYAASGGFSVTGLVGYDVLIQVDPFQFVADFYASVQLKYHSHNLFKVKVEGELSGVRPLHVKGKATFEVFWCDFSVRFDRTLVSGDAPPRPAPVNVTDRLVAALGDPRNWGGQLADGDRRLVTLRDTADASHVRLHPLGVLAVSQAVVPLDLRIARFGNAVPADADFFTIAGVRVDDQPVSFVHTTDNFAPSQFLAMNDADRLAAPSFEPMSAGVRVGGAQGSALATNVDDILEDEAIAYETIIVGQDDTPTGTAGVSAEFVTRYLPLGAAANSKVRRSATTRYQPASAKNAIAADRWSVVSREDQSPVVSTFAGDGQGSYAAAFQALRGLGAQSPAAAAGAMLLRVPETTRRGELDD